VSTSSPVSLEAFILFGMLQISLSMPTFRASRLCFAVGLRQVDSRASLNSFGAGEELLPLLLIESDPSGDAIIYWTHPASI
jgi:hypothetical protein